MTRLTFIFFLISMQLTSQADFTGLSHAGSAIWKGEIYLFGIRPQQKGQQAIIYRLNNDLQVADSMDAGSYLASSQFLRCWSDTLHGLLNIYIQKKGEDLVDVIRIDADHQQSVLIKNVQTARLNNRGMLGAHPYFFASRVYKVHHREDTSGKQFYLNCYEVKDTKKNFDYLLRWQHPFERRHVSDAFVIHADHRLVTLFVTVADGPKKGKWLLSISAANGQLVKGTRACSKETSDAIQYGAGYMDPKNKTLHLVFLKTTKSPAVALVYSSLDSTGTASREKEFVLPWTEPKRGAAKKAPEVLVRFDGANLQQTKLTMQADLYLKDVKQTCFNFCNTVRIDIELSGATPAMARYQLRSNRMIEDWIYLQDKQMINGRICTDSVATVPAGHSSLAFPVKLGYQNNGKTDRFLLQKVETGKAQYSYATYGPEKGKMKVLPVASVKKVFHPQLHLLNDTTYIFRQDVDSAVVRLKKGYW